MKCTGEQLCIILTKINKMENKIGLVEFMEKYMTIKNVDGSFSKPTEQMLEMARVIETAQNEGYDLKLIKQRSGTRIAFEKKVYSPPSPRSLEIRTDMKWTDPNAWLDPEMRQKCLDWQEKPKYLTLYPKDFKAAINVDFKGIIWVKDKDTKKFLVHILPQDWSKCAVDEYLNENRQFLLRMNEIYLSSKHNNK